jgi:two-component system, OmpR family, phosphate regulon response regulator OmpR
MRILVVEDERLLADAVAEGLRHETHAVDVVYDGGAALERTSVNDYDVVVLDRDLPVVHGDEVCRRLAAENGEVRVIMLTAAGEVDDRVDGLALGADDYLPKPFEPRELLARLRAILRRGKDDRKSEVMRFGRLEIDRDAREVRLDGAARSLTSYQHELLLVLAEHAGRVMSRDVLMDLLKAQPLEAFDRSIDVHISRIRAAIEDDAKKPRRVITVRGAGYVFAKAQD